MMNRMQCLRLMPSHTYFYKKLTEHGKDHDLKIKNMVDIEGKRRTAVIQSDKQDHDKEEDNELLVMKQDSCAHKVKHKFTIMSCSVFYVRNIKHFPC